MSNTNLISKGNCNHVEWFQPSLALKGKLPHVEKKWKNIEQACAVYIIHICLNYICGKPNSCSLPTSWPFSWTSSLAHPFGLKNYNQTPTGRGKSIQSNPIFQLAKHLKNPMTHQQFKRQMSWPSQGTRKDKAKAMAPLSPLTWWWCFEGSYCMSSSSTSNAILKEIDIWYILIYTHPTTGFQPYLRRFWPISRSIWMFAKVNLPTWRML